MVLTEFEFVNGLLSLIFVIISIIVGIKIISKYFEYKRKEFLLVGITWIGIVEPWFPSSISFLCGALTGHGLSLELYVLIGNVGIPITFNIWFIAFTDFCCEKKRKLILVLYNIYGLFFEIVLFYLLFTNPRNIGELQGLVDIEYQNIFGILLITKILLITITGIIFSVPSIRSDLQELRIRGKLLIVAFFSYAIGAYLDAGIPLNLLIIILTRILLILSALEWYSGFLLPKWMRKLFINE
ncbi:MAG: hypothetical protein GF353_22895 [Candidatus Lokiarchaeota archaeon]|nr:hypothetical protein [Candidatus Lokiarchaeota archaeon]